MSRIKAVITDVDATIVNNLERRTRAVELVLSAKLTDLQREIAYRAVSIEEIARMVGREPTSEEIERIIDVYLDDLSLYELDEPVEGAVEALNDLHADGYSIIYVTGRPGREYTEPFLRRMGFPRGPVYAERIAGHGGVQTKIRLMERALGDAGLDHRNVASLGDLPQDGIAARALGIFSICTTQLSERSREEMMRYFDAVISHISELKSLLGSI